MMILSFHLGYDKVPTVACATFAACKHPSLSSNIMFILSFKLSRFIIVLYLCCYVKIKLSDWQIIVPIKVARSAFRPKIKRARAPSRFSIFVFYKV